MYNRWRTLRSRHGLPLFEEEGRPVCCWAGALQRTILEPCSNRRCEETVCRRTNAGNGHGAVLPCCLNIPTSRRQAARTTSLPHRREDDFRVAVGTPVDLTPPHGSARAELLHAALTAGVRDK